MDWLDRLRATGIRQAVASSAPPENINTLVDELGIRAYFEAIVSGYDIPGKPDPAVFLKAASEIDLPPQRCIVVEDAVAGVQAAKRAGMRCIAVTTTNPAHALSDADIVIVPPFDWPTEYTSRLHDYQLHPATLSQVDELADEFGEQPYVRAMWARWSFTTARFDMSLNVAYRQPQNPDPDTEFTIIYYDGDRHFRQVECVPESGGWDCELWGENDI